MYPRYEIARLLDISYLRKIVKILEEYNIHPVSKDAQNIEYYRTADLENLLKIQSELYGYYQVNFVTYDEGKKLGASAYDLTLSASIHQSMLL